MKKWIFALVLLSSLGLLASSCGSSGSTTSSSGSAATGSTIPTSTAAEETTEAPTQTTTETVVPSSSEQEATQGISLSIAETVLVDEGGVKITAKALTDDPVKGMRIQIQVENKTDKEIGVSTRSLIINNYMLAELDSYTAAAGETLDDSIRLDRLGQELAGITTVADIALSFEVFDKASRDILFVSKEVLIPTSAHGTVEQPALTVGQELFNEEGVRIFGQYKEGEGVLRDVVLLFIENKNKQDLTFYCSEMTINGHAIKPWYADDIHAGKMAMGVVRVMTSDLEKNSITEIEEIGLKFEIHDPVTYATLMTSDMIVIQVE